MATGKKWVYHYNYYDFDILDLIPGSVDVEAIQEEDIPMEATFMVLHEAEDALPPPPAVVEPATRACKHVEDHPEEPTPAKEHEIYPSPCLWKITSIF